jgi:hypothetical protein
MDGSYLSHAGVIAASRNFVCIRSLTYESAVEAPFLKSLFRGRSGNLENTVFAMLGPDAKTQLCRTGRSPSFAFGSPDDMATAMKQILQKYPAAGPISQPLPLLANVRLGLNVSSCDNTPLAIIYSPDESTRTRLRQQLARLAWGKDHIGQVQYCVATRAEELKPLGLEAPRPGILVVQPSTYGDNGLLISAVDVTAEAGKLVDAIDFALLVSEFQAKTMRSHVSRGQQLGVNWKTAIPVTDSGGRSRRRTGN